MGVEKCPLGTFKVQKAVRESDGEQTKKNVYVWKSSHEMQPQHPINVWNTGRAPGRVGREEPTERISCSGEQRASRSVRPPTASGRFEI